MSKYSIGSISFKTKKACENYTRTKINELGISTINEQHHDYNFFVDLINNHVESDIKIGVGIKQFNIGINPLNKKAYHISITRIDNSEIDFSWIYCCQFKVRTQKEYLIKAMRESISPFTIKFKKQQKSLVCNFCNSKDEEYSDYHVDHDSPSFKELSMHFLNQVKLKQPESFGDCPKTHLTIFHEDDDEFKNEWINYHNSNCRFQILCQKCNLKKH